MVDQAGKKKAKHFLQLLQRNATQGATQAEIDQCVALLKEGVANEVIKNRHIQDAIAGAMRNGHTELLYAVFEHFEGRMERHSNRIGKMGKRLVNNAIKQGFLCFDTLNYAPGQPFANSYDFTYPNGNRFRFLGNSSQQEELIKQINRIRSEVCRDYPEDKPDSIAEFAEPLPIFTPLHSAESITAGELCAAVASGLASHYANRDYWHGHWEKLQELLDALPEHVAQRYAGLFTREVIVEHITRTRLETRLCDTWVSAVTSEPRGNDIALG